MFGIAGRFPLAAAPAAVLVAAALIWTVPTAIAHADAPLVYPGMRINQGTQSCTLGFVDPGARIGLTAGHCALDSDGPVYDDSGNRVGTADIAHFEPTPQDKSFAEQPPIDYEGIAFYEGIPINNVLPNGLVLESNPKIVPAIGMPVCRSGVTTGEACGVILETTDSLLVIDGLPADHGDSGSPVYAITEPGPRGDRGDYHRSANQQVNGPAGNDGDLLAGDLASDQERYRPSGTRGYATGPTQERPRAGGRRSRRTADQ
ncbi:hypothetical protein I541_4030 [Mycobacteroides abscessus]|nr:hypothetical protein I541_4030 [Mycobacteroides abscessus]